MVITESELRELWQNGRATLPTFASGTRFSPAAHDFIKSHRLEITFTTPTPTPHPDSHSTNWDKPGEFPVALTGPLPVCAICGQPLGRKPTHMTQLDAEHFAPKTHPRIKLRGQIDSLHAVIMLIAAEARRYQLPQLADALDTVAAYCREILAAEYKGRAVAPISLLGKSEDKLHAISHRPDQHLGIPHLVPDPTYHAILHWLNLARAQSREVELSALDLYGPHEHTHENLDASGSLPHALNRLSSAIYVLELLFKRGDLSWKV
jgi:ethanolamine utilization cobalamin adenosyltransferase